MSARLLSYLELDQISRSSPRAEESDAKDGNVEALSVLEKPSPQLALSQLTAEGSAIVRFLRLGRVSFDGHPTVFEQEILQARTLFPPVS